MDKHVHDQSHDKVNSLHRLALVKESTFRRCTCRKMILCLYVQRSQVISLLLAQKMHVLHVLEVAGGGGGGGEEDCGGREVSSLHHTSVCVCMVSPVVGR